MELKIIETVPFSIPIMVKQFEKDHTIRNINYLMKNDKVIIIIEYNTKQQAKQRLAKELKEKQLNEAKQEYEKQ